MENYVICFSIFLGVYNHNIYLRYIPFNIIRILCTKISVSCIICCIRKNKHYYYHYQDNMSYAYGLYDMAMKNGSIHRGLLHVIDKLHFMR